MLRRSASRDAAIEPPSLSLAVLSVCKEKKKETPRACFPNSGRKRRERTEVCVSRSIERTSLFSVAKFTKSLPFKLSLHFVSRRPIRNTLLLISLNCDVTRFQQPCRSRPKEVWREAAAADIGKQCQIGADGKESGRVSQGLFFFFDLFSFLSSFFLLLLRRHGASSSSGSSSKRLLFFLFLPPRRPPLLRVSSSFRCHSRPPDPAAGPRRRRRRRRNLPPKLPRHRRLLPLPALEHRDPLHPRRGHQARPEPRALLF